MSADIENIYPSNKQSDAHNAVCELISDKTILSKEALEIYLNYIYHCTIFRFENDYYKLVNGLQISVNNFPILAKCILQKAYLEIIHSKFNNKLYCRFYDDLFLAALKSEYNALCTYLNSLRPYLKLTFECEADSELNYLDVLVNRKRKIITTSV